MSNYDGNAHAPPLPTNAIAIDLGLILQDIKIQGTSLERLIEVFERFVTVVFVFTRAIETRKAEFGVTKRIQLPPCHVFKYVRANVIGTLCELFCFASVFCGVVEIFFSLVFISSALIRITVWLSQ